MENLITNVDFAYLIFLAGATGLAYHFGKKEGIGITLDYMKHHGHIDFEED